MIKIHYTRSHQVTCSFMKGYAMKRVLATAATLVALTASLSGCGGSFDAAPAPSKSSEPPKVLNGVGTDNNTDPYKGWVEINPDAWSGDILSFICTTNGTAIYRVGGAVVGAPVPKSPDCTSR